MPVGFKTAADARRVKAGSELAFELAAEQERVRGLVASPDPIQLVRIDAEPEDGLSKAAVVVWDNTAGEFKAVGEVRHKASGAIFPTRFSGVTEDGKAIYVGPALGCGLVADDKTGLINVSVETLAGSGLRSTPAPEDSKDQCANTLSVALGCGLIFEEVTPGGDEEPYDAVAVDPQQLAGDGLDVQEPDEEGGCSKFKAKADCHILVNEDGISVTPTTLIGLGLEVQAPDPPEEGEPAGSDCDKIRVKAGCHIEVNEAGVNVYLTKMAGNGLDIQAGEEGSPCNALTVRPGCGIIVDAGGVSVDVESMAGAGLTSNGAMPCPALEVDVADCGALTFIGGKLAVDVAALAGPGLVTEAGEDDCDQLKVNVGCGLQLSEGGDFVTVKNSDLAGEGLLAGEGCALDIDTKFITDIVEDKTGPTIVDVGIKIKDCKLVIEFTRSDGTVGESPGIDICCLVVQCGSEKPGVCDPGWYCLADEVGARTCLELACGDPIPEGYTVVSGPHATIEECQAACGSKWYCVLVGEEYSCREVPHGWYVFADGTEAEINADNPLAPGNQVNSGPHGDQLAAQDAGDAPVEGQTFTVIAGPFDTAEECAEANCAMTNAKWYCTTIAGVVACAAVAAGWYRTAGGPVQVGDAGPTFGALPLTLTGGPFPDAAAATAGADDLPDPVTLTAGQYATEAACIAAGLCASEPCECPTLNLRISGVSSTCGSVHTQIVDHSLEQVTEGGQCYWHSSVAIGTIPDCVIYHRFEYDLETCSWRCTRWNSVPVDNAEEPGTVITTDPMLKVRFTLTMPDSCCTGDIVIDLEEYTP